MVYLNHGISDHIRGMTWKSAVDIWVQYPLFGCGAESYVDAWHAFRSPAWIALVGNTLQDHAHNDFLEALAAFGLVGLIAYCNLLYRIYAIKWDRPTLGAIVAVFICAKFNAVPFAVLFVMALILGSQEDGVPIRDPSLPQAVAIVLACAFAYLLAVDTMFYHARRKLDFPGVMRASALAPYEILYQAHEADLLTRKYLADENPFLLLRALDISRVALKRHPGSVQARHMLTQTLIMLAQVSPAYIKEAQESAALLNDLDPSINYRFTIKGGLNGRN